MSSGYSTIRDALATISTEAELTSAVTSGLLQEGQNLDFKRDPWPKANDEMLKDLGAMAFSGGFILLGVDERSDQPLYPFALNGVRERVDQAAQSLSPPLPVATREIPSTATGEGYVIVDIPPSPALIHYLNSGRTPWREDVITRWLTADEARRLDGDRSTAQANVAALLDANIPLPHPRPTNQFNKETQVHVVARPVFPGRRLLVEQIQDDPNNFGARGFVWSTLANADTQEEGNRQSIAASKAMDLGALFVNGVTVDPTDTGVALSATNNFASYVRAEIEADATVHLYVHNVGEHIQYQSGASTPVLNDRSLVILVRQAVRVVEAVIATTHHRGPWWFGISIKNLSDYYPLSRQPTTSGPDNNPRMGHALKGGHYQRIDVLSAQDIEGGANAIAERLLGDLFHRMGAKSTWKASGLFG